MSRSILEGSNYQAHCCSDGRESEKYQSCLIGFLRSLRHFFTVILKLAGMGVHLAWQTLLSVATYLNDSDAFGRV
eukprot:8393384-Alexandrium_andersonii.AAC.1